MIELKVMAIKHVNRNPRITPGPPKMLAQVALFYHLLQVSRGMYTSRLPEMPASDGVSVGMTEQFAVSNIEAVRII
jgi:hypothetical protein